MLPQVTEFDMKFAQLKFSTVFCFLTVLITLTNFTFRNAGSHNQQILNVVVEWELVWLVATRRLRSTSPESPPIVVPSMRQNAELKVISCH